MRVFIAITLPGEAKQLLGQIQSRLKSKGIKASWPKKESFHLTVKFLGEVDPDSIQPLKEAMAEVASDFSGFDLWVGGLGFFPSVKKARVLWAGVGHDTDILENLERRLDARLQYLGIKMEKKRFFPHITLARVKKHISPGLLISLMQDCDKIRSRPFRIKAIDLFYSELSPRGACHTRLFRSRVKSIS